jgi:molybdopterin-binding protein
MTKTTYTAAEAARSLGVSLDTLRRWDRSGRVATTRDSRNRRIVDVAEIERLRGEGARDGLSARNRFRGIVTEVTIEGLMAQVEIQVTEPTRVVALVTRAAVEELGLKPGMPGTAIVKATSVMIEG